MAAVNWTLSAFHQWHWKCTIKWDIFYHD